MSPYPGYSQEQFEDDCTDIRREERARKRRRLANSCADGYCGALDCKTCNPFEEDDSEIEDPE